MTVYAPSINLRVYGLEVFVLPNKPIALLTEVERGASVKVFINLENGEEYYPLEGTMAKGLSVIKITQKDDNRGQPPVCRLVSFSLRDSSKQRCKLSRMTLIYIPTTDEDPMNDDDNNQ